MQSHSCAGAAGSCTLRTVFLGHFSLPEALQDAVFAAAANAQKARDAGRHPIDGTIGVLTDDRGDPAHPLIFPCVRQAIDAMYHDWERHPGFPYSPLLGVTAYREAMKRLVFGAEATVASISAAGGTAAVALNLHLAKLMGIGRAILPVPTWPNHRQLLEGSGLSYTEIKGAMPHPPSPEQLLAAARASKDPVLFLLQANAHNPTGHQWTKEQWRVFADGVSGSAHIVLLDCAYQGLSEGVEEDRAPALLLREAGVRLLFAGSSSKNHGVYGLRVGWACAVVSSPEEERQLEQWYRILTRRMYSTAPTFGQLIVAKVQEEYQEEWRRQLGAVRTGTDRKRRVLRDAFPEWADSIEGTGLFTMLPLSAHAIARLQEDDVFLTHDGRVNLAGIPLGRFDEFLRKIRRVREGITQSPAGTPAG